MLLMLLPCHKFVHLPHSYQTLKEIISMQFTSKPFLIRTIISMHVILVINKFIH